MKMTIYKGKMGMWVRVQKSPGGEWYRAGTNDLEIHGKIDDLLWRDSKEKAQRDLDRVAQELG